MRTHSFTFVVEGVDPEDEHLEDKFFDAGCDDATIALMRGMVAVCFDRRADRYVDAVLSAYENVRDAGASVVRFEPDFLVNATEIADRAGLSRAAISLYEKGERASGYPHPVARITTGHPLWDWVDVSRWLFSRGKLSEDAVRSAQVSRLINEDAQKNASPAQIRARVESAIAEPIVA